MEDAELVNSSHGPQTSARALRTTWTCYMTARARSAHERRRLRVKSRANAHADALLAAEPLSCRLLDEAGAVSRCAPENTCIPLRRRRHLVVADCKPQRARSSGGWL